MRRLLQYLNPISRLGHGSYSYLFPLIANLSLIILSEIFAYGILRNPMAVGVYIIFLNVAFIIFFAFRDGIQGGLISAVLSVLYYFYIIFTRHFTGSQFASGIDTTIILAVLYCLLAIVIGWLKQVIDSLIEREANEKRRLEAIIQQLPVGVLITDEKGRLTHRNKQLDSILGVKMPIGFTVGQDTLSAETIDGKPINPTDSPLANALRTRRPILGREFTYQHNKGKPRSLRVSSAPIQNKKKKVIAAATIVQDITRQKELEKQKDEFLGIASHELKTPVTSIKAYGQALQSMFRKRGEDKAAEQLQKMDTQINKLTSLIEDLLDVTKIQSGRLEFRPGQFDFNSLVNEVVDELQLTTAKHELAKNLAKTTTIFADRERIGQVMTNLITNAIKYSPNAKKIIIKTELKKDAVSFCVQDFGVGIPPGNREKVFEQFYRVSGPKQNTFPGLGLGLYISNEIIKREGGRIWVESSTNKGSTFCFQLPLVGKEKS